MCKVLFDYVSWRVEIKIAKLMLVSEIGILLFDEEEQNYSMATSAHARLYTHHSPPERPTECFH